MVFVWPIRSRNGKPTYTDEQNLMPSTDLDWVSPEAVQYKRDITMREWSYIKEAFLLDLLNSHPPVKKLLPKWWKQTEAWKLGIKKFC